MQTDTYDLIPHVRGMVGRGKGWLDWADAFFSSLRLKGGAAAFQTQQQGPPSFITAPVPNNPSLVGNIQLPKLPSPSLRVTQANVIMAGCMRTTVIEYVSLKPLHGVMAYHPRAVASAKKNLILYIVK
jgi:hypothetical protein